MADASTTFVLDEIAPHDAYKLCSGLIVPRPIGWVGTLSADGIANLAPYSFFNLIGNDPMHVAFAPGSVGGSDKDSLANVRVVPEFTVNIVTDETVVAMNETAATLPPEEDEFEHAGLTKLDSLLIRPPRVAEATATMECKVTDIVHVGRDGGGNDLVVGEVIAIHVADRVLDGTRIDQHELRAVGRHAGSWYSHATDLFDISRPS